MTSSQFQTPSTDSGEVYPKKKTELSSTKPRRSWKEFIQRRDSGRVYVCNAAGCSKAFNYLSSLVKHERIHRGERPYTCKYCQQSFVQSSNLKRHERTHTGEKSFQCERCDKKFSTASNLKQHVQIHKEENQRKHFGCKKCGREYLYLSSMSKHAKLCDGVPVAGKESQHQLQTNDSLALEPALKKMVKVEEEKPDEIISQNDQKTHIEESSAGSSPNSQLDSYKKLLSAQTPVIKLESDVRSNHLLLNPLATFHSQTQPTNSYPLLSSNTLLLNQLLPRQVGYSNLLQSVRPAFNGCLDFSYNAMDVSRTNSALLLRQQLQNRLLQQATLPLGLSRMSFF